MRVKRITCDACGTSWEVAGDAPWPRRTRVKLDLCKQCTMHHGLSDADRAALERARQLTGLALRLPPSSLLRAFENSAVFASFPDEMALRDALSQVRASGRLRYVLLSHLDLATVGQARAATWPRKLRNVGAGTRAEAHALGVLVGT